MKVVLDTNVLVSAFQTPFKNCDRIVEAALLGDLQLCYDERVLGEYKDVLARPHFKFPQAQVRIVLERLVQKGLPVIARSLQGPLPDEKDRAFLEVALSAPADCLVSGNLKHYPKSPFRGLRILNPTEFLAVLGRGRA